MKNMLTLLLLSSLFFTSTLNCFADSLATKAVSAFEHGNYKVAQSLFQQLTEQQPKNGRAHYYLALSSYKLNQLSQAKSYFQQVVTAFPETQEAKYSLQYINVIESVNKTVEPGLSSLPTTQLSGTSTANNDKADRELTEAKAQAEQMRAEGKRRAEFYYTDAKNTADSMRSVLGRRNNRVYSDATINDATSEQKSQAQRIIDTANKEADDFLQRAQLRYDSQTRR